MEPQVNSYIHVLFFILYLFIISVNGGPNGFRLKIVHKDSIDSPIHPGNLTTEETVQRLVQQSVSRARYLTLRKNITSGAINPEARLPISWEGISYIAEIGIGSFNEKPVYKSYHLLVDTGSDITWLQCEGCINCFHQDQPLFPYQKSTSYENLPGNHRFCDKRKRSGGPCSYSIQYEDGSNTTGVLGKETLNVLSEKGGTEEMEQFIFGCGLNQQRWSPIGDNRREGKPDLIAGILGMSASSKSFLGQLGTRGKNRFSYCLLPYGASKSTFLNFGDSAKIESNTKERVYRTPLIISDDLYYLELLDVSIAGKRLGFTPDTFKLKGRSGGCCIDSGSPYTHISVKEYRIIELSVLEYFKNVKIKPSTDDKGICFPTQKDVSIIPKITFHLKNGDFDAEFMTMRDKRTLCLGMIPNKDIVGGLILGGYQTANHRIVYDLNAKILSFVREQCVGV